MAYIQGADNPGNKAHVDNRGRLEVHSTAADESVVAAIDEDAFNLNTGNITLTDAVETPLFYIKNVGEERAIIVPRIFVYSGASTGGSGPVNLRVVYNPTGGTLLTGTTLPIHNFNAGSGNQISVDTRVGVTGSTLTGGTTPIRTLIPSAPVDKVIPFGPAIILPRGSSMAFMFTPPAGNTSIIVQAGINLYLEAE